MPGSASMAHLGDKNHVNTAAVVRSPALKKGSSEPQLNHVDKMEEPLPKRSSITDSAGKISLRCFISTSALLVHQTLNLLFGWNFSLYL